MSRALQQFFARCPALLFIADEDGRLVHISAALRERFAARLDDPPTLASLAAADERESIRLFLRALATSDEPAVCSFRVDEDGTHTRLRCQAQRGADGSIHGQLEPVTQERRIEHVLLHALINTLDLAVWAIDSEGTFVFHDGKALASVGLERGQHLGRNIFDLYPSSHTDAIHEALAGTHSHDTNEARGTHWETWYLPLRDERGATEFCAGVSLDITATVETERALRRQLDTIMDQQRAIRELSTPVIRVWDQVLTAPLSGRLDEALVEELSERLLAACGPANARFAILDLTGIEALDTSAAGTLLRLLGGLRLLGVEGLITGISPDVAQTMTGLGVEFGSPSYRTLGDGLRACMLALLGASSSCDLPSQP